MLWVLGFRVQGLGFFFSVEALRVLFFCCAAPPICKHNARTMGFNKKQRGGWGGGRSAPHLQTHGSHDGFRQDSYVLQHACTAKNKQRGLGGAQPPPPRPQQTQCSYDMFCSPLAWLKRGVGGGAAPPFANTTLVRWVQQDASHLQAHGSHDGFQQDSYVLQHACTAKNTQRGGWGGRSPPPPFANTMLVRWASTRRICFEARFARL